MGRGHEHIDGIGELLRLVGMAGVDHDETKAAHYWETVFAWPMLLMALWLIIQWVMQDRGYLSLSLANTISWLIWLAFIVETAVLTYCVEDKFRYLRTNWMNLFIIFSAIPVLFTHSMQMTGVLRSLRLLVIPRMVISWWRR